MQIFRVEDDASVGYSASPHRVVGKIAERLGIRIGAPHQAVMVKLRPHQHERTLGAVHPPPDLSGAKNANLVIADTDLPELPIRGGSGRWDPMSPTGPVRGPNQTQHGLYSAATVQHRTAKSFKRVRPTLKRVSPEPGGKSANLVFADADLDWSIKAPSPNSGQVCLAGSRLYVERAIFDEFAERFVDLAERLVVGNSTDNRANQNRSTGTTAADFMTWDEARL
jgi:hypothetical protein